MLPVEFFKEFETFDSLQKCSVKPVLKKKLIHFQRAHFVVPTTLLFTGGYRTHHGWFVGTTLSIMGVTTS